jgi:alkylhydroperoxidase family enzyme
MFAKMCRVIVCVAALLSAGAGAAQPITGQPGSRQPVALTKPRIAPLPEAQWTDVHRGLVAKFTRDGRADNALKTMLHVPELVEGVMPYTIYLSEESALSPRHREMLVLRTAWLCGNQPLWATHAARARKAGMEAGDLRRLAQGPDAPGWDPFEATLLRMADQLYRNSSVTGATWQAVSARFDLFHLMDAVETVNHFVVLSLVYNSFGVQPDEGLVDRLPTDVPYRVVVPAREPPLATARVEPGEGRGIAVSRTFARYPTLNVRWSPRQTFINRTSKLSPRHREMLILRMGWNCRAEYEWAKHVGTVGRARDHGLDPARIAEGPQASGWDPFESNLLRVSDDLYRDAIVSDGTWRGLADRFDTGLAMSAVFTASAYRAISMSLNSYGVQLEEGDERFPQVPAR